MKGSKTLLWLGLAAFSAEALAEAQTTREEQFQLGAVGVSLGAGLLNGQAREKVYDVESGQKISQLNWSMKQVPTLHLGVKYQPVNWLSLDLNGWTRVAKGDGHMKDYDWLEDDRSDWSHYSDHPDTQVSKAWQADVAATAWALKRDDLALGMMLGYQRNQFGWQARGGRYTYSSGEGFRDDSGEFPAGQKGISYQQTYDTPYVGLVGLYHFRNWTLEGKFKYSQWVRARDHDRHHVTGVSYDGDYGNSGRMQSLAVALSYRVTPQLSLRAGVDHQVYAEAKGSTLIKDAHTGERLRIAGDAGSQSAMTTMSTLALTYAF
jgi:plasminogen activator